MPSDVLSDPLDIALVLGVDLGQVHHGIVLVLPLGHVRSAWDRLDPR